ncbi:hypothetical protein BDY21DRAFT_330941 [Lineolata rhizophorae]|uniref:Uncharacterized protein n=1 Tax=Lineolata rhizophorae TaxID=578093 RepID=A0A6A6PE65_9PEZI|nr:hypothetical protein BDY21DRAFT_330941 [Lineolata rhizophorae]
MLFQRKLASPFEYSKGGRSLLLEAAMLGHLEIVEFLLQQGADPDNCLLKPSSLQKLSLVFWRLSAAPPKVSLTLSCIQHSLKDLPLTAAEILLIEDIDLRYCSDHLNIFRFTGDTFGTHDLLYAFRKFMRARSLSLEWKITDEFLRSCRRDNWLIQYYFDTILFHFLKANRPEIDITEKGLSMAVERFKRFKPETVKSLLNWNVRELQNTHEVLEC